MAELWPRRERREAEPAVILEAGRSVERSIARLATKSAILTYCVRLCADASANEARRPRMFANVAYAARTTHL